MRKKKEPSNSSVSLIEKKLALKLTMGSTRIRMKEISEEEIQRRLVLPKRKSPTITSIEIKARCSDTNRIREILNSKNAKVDGLAHQIDTYFKVKTGRLKLRQSNSYDTLIYYERENIRGPKKSVVTRCSIPHVPASLLKEILSKAMEILAVVDKQREIFYLENVEFHLDTVQGLESLFVEIEAIDEDGSIGESRLMEQCMSYLKLFQIKESDLESGSYSDMLLKKSTLTSVQNKEHQS